MGKLVKSENMTEILSCCDEFTPGDPPEYFFDRYRKAQPQKPHGRRLSDFLVKKGKNSFESTKNVTMFSVTICIIVHAHGLALENKTRDNFTKRFAT